MLHHPGVMKRAQAEIDQIVGFSRMPEYDDMESLPYVNALINEVARCVYASSLHGAFLYPRVPRWRPVARTGFPHQLTQDDTYNGYFLPKGATVYANIKYVHSVYSLATPTNHMFSVRSCKTLNFSLIQTNSDPNASWKLPTRNCRASQSTLASGVASARECTLLTSPSSS